MKLSDSATKISFKKAEGNFAKGDVNNPIGALLALATRRGNRKKGLGGRKGPTGKVIFQGWIEKRGEKLNDEWKKRWAVIEEGLFWYYDQQPSEAQFQAWQASGGQSPRRPGQARSQEAQKDVGGAKTLGFWLLANVSVCANYQGVVLAGPLLDTGSDWSSVVKEFRIPSGEGKISEWHRALREAIVYHDTVESIGAIPSIHGPSLASPFAGEIIFTRAVPPLTPEGLHDFSAEGCGPQQVFKVNDDICGIVCLPALIRDLPLGLMKGKRDNEPSFFSALECEGRLKNVHKDVLFGELTGDATLQQFFVIKVNGSRFELPLPAAQLEPEFPMRILAPYLRNLHDKEQRPIDLQDSTSPELAFGFRKISSPLNTKPLLMELEDSVGTSQGGIVTVELEMEFCLAAFSYSEDSNFEGFYFRNLAKGKCTVTVTPTKSSSRYDYTKPEMNAQEQAIFDRMMERNRNYAKEHGTESSGGYSDYSSTGGGGGGEESYSPPTSPKSSTSKSSSSQSDKKPLPRPPKEVKLSKCSHCNGTGQNRCDQCTSGTRSKCNHCKGTGLRGKCSWCSGRGEK